MRVKSKRTRVKFESRTDKPKSEMETPALESDATSLKMMAARQPIWVNPQEGDTESIIRDDIDPLSCGGNTISRIANARRPTPELYTTLPPIRDSLITGTSISQDEVIEVCLPHLVGAGKHDFNSNTVGVPMLQRNEHVNFLKNAIQDARYIPYDASRPWIVYWSLTGLSLLGQEVQTYHPRVVETFSVSQNPGGGFGGGHGQLSHIAPSYAAILSLVMVGGSESLDVIDRRNL